MGFNLWKFFIPLKALGKLLTGLVTRRCCDSTATPCWRALVSPSEGVLSLSILLIHVLFLGWGLLEGGHVRKWNLQTTYCLFPSISSPSQWPLLPHHPCFRFLFCFPACVMESTNMYLFWYYTFEIILDFFFKLLKDADLLAQYSMAFGIFRQKPVSVYRSVSLIFYFIPFNANKMEKSFLL